MRWSAVVVAGLLVLGCDDPPAAGSAPGTPPHPPRVLAVYRLTGGAVALGWDPAIGAVEQLVQRTRDATGEVATVALAADARSLVDSGTLPSTVYTYRVRGTNGAGIGAPAALGIETAAPDRETLVLPATVTLGPNGKQAFGAIVNGDRNAPVTWVVLEGTFGGQVSETGTYRAPLRTGRFHLLAVAADTVAGMATIDVQ